jgi:FtsP/CotA-like multicopper oxidase with cupredoxin domain
VANTRLCARAGSSWCTINGQAAPDVPPIDVSEGQIVRLHIVDTTAEYHPMHLHGHVMTVHASNGVAPRGSPIHLDSIMVGPHEPWDVQSPPTTRACGCFSATFCCMPGWA